MDKKELTKLKKELSSLPSSDNVRCFLLYGSIFKKKKSQIKDTDIIIVLNDISLNTDDLFAFIFKNFPQPDIHIYSVDEIEHDISFYTREFVLEYLAKAFCLYGENILITKFTSVTNQQYRESLFIRSIEYVQMGRKVYFSEKYDVTYKEYFLKKYSVRLARSILLFKGLARYDALDKLSDDQILKTLQQKNLLQENVYSKGIGLWSLEDCYRVFCGIGMNLIGSKNDL